MHIYLYNDTLLHFKRHNNNKKVDGKDSLALSGITYSEFYNVRQTVTDTAKLKKEFNVI